MRANGGRLSWKDWEPSTGMVGHVVHVWVPNHKEELFRSHVNRCVYLIEIGEHYVPVEELGLREYNQILGSSTEEVATSRRSSVQLDFNEYSRQVMLARQTTATTTSASASASTSSSNKLQHKPQIRAVSSSSSEDEDEIMVDNGPAAASGSTATSSAAAAAVAASGASGDALTLPPGVNFNTLLNMWKLIADKKKQAINIDTTEPFAAIDYTGELPPDLMRQLEESRMAKQQLLEEQQEEELRKHLQKLEDEANALAAEQALHPITVETPPSNDEELSLEVSGTPTPMSTGSVTTPTPPAEEEPEEKQEQQPEQHEEGQRVPEEKQDEIAEQPAGEEQQAELDKGEPKAQTHLVGEQLEAERGEEEEEDGDYGVTC